MGSLRQSGRGPGVPEGSAEPRKLTNELGFSRGPGGGTGVLRFKYTYEEKGLGFRVYDSHCVRFSSLGWVSLCCYNPPAQWSLVIFAFIPSSCSSSFRAAVPSVLPSTLVRLLPFFVLLQRPSKGRNLLPKGSWPGFGPKEPFPNDPRRRF